MFQSSIVPKNDRNLARVVQKDMPEVPILDRPEERSQSSGDWVGVRRAVFQSSIVPKNDRNSNHRRSGLFLCLVPILDRPEERSQ